MTAGVGNTAALAALEAVAGPGAGALAPTERPSCNWLALPLPLAPVLALALVLGVKFVVALLLLWVPVECCCTSEGGVPGLCLCARPRHRPLRREGGAPGRGVGWRCFWGGLCAGYSPVAAPALPNLPFSTFTASPGCSPAPRVCPRSPLLGTAPGLLQVRLLVVALVLGPMLALRRLLVQGQRRRLLPLLWGWAARCEWSLPQSRG